MSKKTVFGKVWDIWLLNLTFFSLLSLGVISLLGTIYTWWQNLNQPGWQETWVYSHYLNSMNILAFPFALALTALVVLCLPKRLTNKKILLAWLGLASFGSFLSLAFWGIKGFMIVFFGSSLLASLLTVFLLLARPEGLKFGKEGRISKLGSLLLHSGYLIFLANIVILYNSPAHLKLFWLAFALIILGNLLIFQTEKSQKTS